MIKVLADSKEMEKAQSLLIDAGLNLWEFEKWRKLLPFRALNKIGLMRDAFLPIREKAWDTIHSLNTIKSNFSIDDPVLDMGCKNSPILPCLALSGFTNLTGIDLDKSVLQQPNYGCIKWITGNFYDTEFPDSSFSAITSISAIEHGLNTEKLALEATRLLMPGGYFIISTDYNRDKIDTSSEKPFDLSWNIFSENEINKLLELFGQYGFHPIGEIDLLQNESPICWRGKRYTFLFMVLVKNI